MAVRVVCYKNIFSNAGVIHELPDGISIEAARKELGLSSISRVLCNGAPCTSSILHDTNTYEFYESVGNDAVDSVVDFTKTTGKHVGNFGSTFVKEQEAYAKKLGFGKDLAGSLLYMISMPTVGLVGAAVSAGIKNVTDSLVPDTPAGGDVDTKQKAALESRPDISGAKNRSATGGTVPVILGRRLITPQAIGTYWTEPAGTDGEDLYVHGLLVVGYGPLLIERIRLGDYDLGITTTEANCRNVVLTANKSTSTWLADEDECILHIAQENVALDARTYDTKVVEEAVNLEIVWPNNVSAADYRASAPPRMTAAGAVRVDATISAKGFVQYNGNYEEDIEGVTFKMLYRIPDTLTWKEFTTQTVKAVPTGRFLKEIRYVVSGTFPTNLTGPHTRFEVTIVRSRANKVDASPDGNYSYLDSWQWDTLRTITNVAPISASMCSKVCRIGFRIKATKRLSGNLDAINLIATSILPTLKHSAQGSRWLLGATDAWHATTNPADFYVAAFLDIWCNTEDIAVDGSTLTGRAKLEYWQNNDLGLDWNALADYHLWCDEAVDVQLTDASIVHLAHQCEVNVVISSQMKLQELLQAVLSVGRASFVYKNGKYSIVHDARYGGYSDLNHYHNPVNGMIRQALITPRDAEFSFSRQFDEDYDEAVIEFVTAASNQYQQVSVTIRNPYVSDATYNAHRAAGKLRVYKANTRYITNVYQIQLWITYQFAVQALRKLAASVKVGPAQYGYALGSRITIAHDMLLKGFGSARISSVATVGTYLHITMDDVLYGDALSGGTQKDLAAYIWILDPVTETQRAVVMDCSMVDYTAHDASIASFAKIAIHLQDFYDDHIDKDAIIRGLRIAVGVKGVTAEDFILVGKTVDAQHGAQLTLMQAADGVHLIDQRTYAPYNYATSPTQTAIAAQVEASKPAVRTIQANLANLQSIAQSIALIQDGDSTKAPAVVTAIEAIAYQDYIDITIIWDNYGLENNISGFDLDVYNGVSWETLHITSATYTYVFDRGIVGYPEKTGATAHSLDNWRIRARAVNIYNQISPVYGPSVDGIPLDLSQYKTWIPPKPTVSYLRAVERGLEYLFSVDETSFYGSDKKYTLTLNGTVRASGIYSKEGVLLFNRVTDGYPETIAERTAHSITAGTALDDFVVTIKVYTAENPTGNTSASQKPDVTGYKTWIPHLPSIAVAAAGRNITLRFTPGNDCYGQIKYRFQVQKSTDGSDFYAVGDNAQAWADETAYRTGADGGYSETPLETYVQVVPLTKQSDDRPEDTTYNYRAAAVQSVLEGSGGVYITAYTSIATAIARATATKDIVSSAVKTAQLASGAVTNDKILARTIRAENISVTARSKINTFNDPDDGLTGWSTGGVIETVDNSRALKLTAPSNTHFATTPFTVEPDEILAFSFGLQCPNYTTASGLFIGLTTAQTFKRYTWSFTSKKWVYSSSGANSYFISDYKATTRKNFKTYILGSSVNITDTPAPSYTDETYPIICLQLMPGDRTASIRSGYNATTAGTYWYLFNPLVVTVGASKIVAEQIEVTSLAAVNSRLGQVQGDDTANYKLVLGQGFDDPEGTFLLGSVNDAAYFRRYQSGGKWYLDIKTSNFIVTSVASTIIGTFYIKNLGTDTDANATIKVDPSTKLLMLQGAAGKPPTLQIASPGIDTTLEFYRGGGAASWRIVNTGGVLKFQNNYTTGVTSYFDVLSLNLNTGPITAHKQLFAAGGSSVAPNVSSGYLLIGSGNGPYLALDGSTVQSKASGTTVGDLKINPFGGKILLGKPGYTNDATYILGGSTVSLTADAGFLIIGSSTLSHIAIDDSKIQAKLNGTTVGPLYINREGGEVYIGKGGSLVQVAGIIRATSDGELQVGSAGAYFKANSSGAWSITPATSDNSTRIATTAYVKAQVLGGAYPVGCFYTQYPDASSNTDSAEFPVSQRPATLFGGTWVEQWSTESVFFRTRGTLSDTGRTNGKQEDQMQQITGQTRVFGRYLGTYDDSAGALRTVASAHSGTAGMDGNAELVVFNSANSPGARTGPETRAVNRRIKVWKRTA